MIKKSKYNTKRTNLPKLPLRKVIKVFFQLKAEELKEFGWNALKAIGFLIGMLALFALLVAGSTAGIIGIVYLLKYVFTFTGTITLHFFNLIGHHTTTNLVSLGGKTILVSMLFTAILATIYCFVSWIKSNWRQAKKLVRAEM